ncbi:hypothetical protein TCON_1074 [Astathelohania contejeani]|uniref:Uncharacterized protein n=1 Tax=Astathelohania contejeani TaxID=164912 RepID=A0ABQ7HZZ7_9MICR|nr:hypothetical protein TCON_1074 [Thelohania contejeani]
MRRHDEGINLNVRRVPLTRVDRLCNTKLDTRNLYRFIREYTFTFINQNIGLQLAIFLRFITIYVMLSSNIRKISDMIFQKGNPTRTVIRRSLQNMEFDSLCILY